MTPMQWAEVQQWMNWYAHLVETGTPADDVPVFPFSTPIMNTALFSPRHAVARLITQATLTDVDVCEIVLGSRSHDFMESTAHQYYVDFLRNGMIATDLVDEPEASMAHFMAVIEAPDTVWAEIVGEFLISDGLPLPRVDADPSIPIFADVGLQSQEIIQSIQAMAPDMLWFSLVDADRQAQYELRNHFPSNADLLRAGLELRLDLNSDFDPSLYTLRRADAVFGIFGRLPLVVAEFADGVLLIDGITGAVSGPFEPGLPLDATELLLAHPEAYTAGMPVQIIDAAHCPVGSWKPQPQWQQGDPGKPNYRPKRDPAEGPHDPIDWTDPNPPLSPPFPVVPSPVQLDPNKDGWYDKWDCSRIDGVCSCVTYGMEINRDGVPVRTRRECTSTDANCQGNDHNVTPPTDSMPRPKPAGPNDTWNCTTYHWYQ